MARRTRPRSAGGPAGPAGAQGAHGPALTRRRTYSARASGAAAAAAVFINRLLRRAAWFLWMTPLLAALSRRFWARRSASPALSAAVSASCNAAFTRVFSSLLTALLRSRAFRLVRLRFFWLLMLATTILHAGGQELPEQPVDLTSTTGRPATQARR